MTARTDRHINNVRNRYSREIDELRRHMRRWLNPDRVNALGSATAAFVAEYTAVHAYAPSRREVIAALALAEHVPAAPDGMPSRFKPQWQAEATDLVFSRLRHAGWLEFTSAPRSLRPGQRLTSTGSNAPAVLAAAS